MDLSNKSDEFVAKYKEAVGGDASIRPKVPLLEYGKELFVESDVITRWIAENISDDGMYPVNPKQRDCVDRFNKAFEKVVDGYYKFVGGSSAKEVMDGQTEFCGALKALEQHITGPFCLGETFSIAECLSAPWVHRFKVILPHFRGVTVDELLPKAPVCQWMNEVLARPSVESTNGPEDYLISSTKSYFVKYITPGSPADQ